MRILLVIPNIVSFNSFLTELSSALIEKRVDVHCAFSLDALWGSGENPVGIPVQMHGIPFARGMNPVAHAKASLQLNSLVSSIRPDIVHAHFSSAIFATALAMRKHWPTTIGTFQGVHFLLSRGVITPLTKMAETWAANRLDQVWVLSKDDLEGLRLAVPHAKINKQASYGFGCDLERFNTQRYSLKERQELGLQLGLEANNYVFTFAGRYVHFKGFDVTVRAFLKLARTEPDIRLLLMGTRDNQHATGLTNSEEQALKDSVQVIDLGWQNEFEKYFAVTDVLVFPSEREGMPVSLMAAIAMGVPAITRNSRGCRDVVRDQVNGIVLNSCTVGNLILEMQRLKQDRTLHRRLSANCLAGRERFNQNNYVTEQIKIYQDLYSNKDFCKKRA